MPHFHCGANYNANDTHVKPALRPLPLLFSTVRCHLSGRERLRAILDRADIVTHLRKILESRVARILRHSQASFNARRGADTAIWDTISPQGAKIDRRRTFRRFPRRLPPLGHCHIGRIGH